MRLNGQTTVTYTAQGQYDDFFFVSLADDGRFRIEQGGYQTQKPRCGRVATEKARSIIDAAKQAAKQIRPPDGQTEVGFLRKLSIVTPEIRCEGVWQGPAPTPVRELVNELQSL